MNPKNIETFREYIKELVEKNPGYGLNPTWVDWMLHQLESEHAINPAWLRAERGVWFIGTPLPKQVPPLIKLAPITYIDEPTQH